MSLVDLYASEARFKSAQTEYTNLMRSLTHSCLDKYKASSDCLRAAQLNANMQAELIHMSTLMKTVDPTEPGLPTVAAQQQKLTTLARSLAAEYAALLEQPAVLHEVEVIGAMQHSHFVLWFVAAGVLTAVALL